jgi:hypothetical protein
MNILFFFFEVSNLRLILLRRAWFRMLADKQLHGQCPLTVRHIRLTNHGAPGSCVSPAHAAVASGIKRKTVRS